MATRNLRNGTLVIQDGAGTPLTITVTLDMGDLSWTERRSHNAIDDRGTLDHWRKGVDVPCEFSFSVKFAGFATGNVASGTVSLHEAITNTGGANGVWASTTASTDDAWALDMVFTCADPVSGGTDDTITFSDCVYDEVSFNEGEEFNVLSCSGRALQTAPAIT